MSTHLGTTAFLDTPTVNGSNVMLDGGSTPSIGQGTSLPSAGTAGRLFFNTAENIIYRDTGSAWVRVSSPVIQTITGSISNTSSNAVIPLDSTVPLSTEGFQLFSVSFTPLRADSTIVLEVSGWYALTAGADVYLGGAFFSGTTCVFAGLAGFTTNPGGNTFSMMANTTSGSTAARTYSFRVGPNASATTVFIGQTTGAVTYGSTTQAGRYRITEIAP